jgi:glycine cleavage system aminomethyltransferase T
MRLLQGRRRQDAARRLRAEGQALGHGRHSEDFCFDQLPEDFDHFEPILEQAVNRLPLLPPPAFTPSSTGPESFTPDDRYYLGEAPEIAATGWLPATIRSASCPRAARVLRWRSGSMTASRPSICGMSTSAGRSRSRRTGAICKERVSETLGLLYADHFPYRQKATARGVRRSPIHEQLKARGAVFGEVAGWERANWFADEARNASTSYSWKRQNWFENQKRRAHGRARGCRPVRHDLVRQDPGRGPRCACFLQRLCANDMDVEPGRIVYTQMLNARGGIECDLTVTRLSETAFLLVVPGATLQRDLAWLRRHVGDEFVVITDVTAAEAVLCVMGPNARSLMQAVSPNDFSNEAHPFGMAREIEIGMGLARAHRVTYVGELGWELYVSSPIRPRMCSRRWRKPGSDHGLKLCGLHTLDSCRIEKAFRHFGHDITDEDHVLEAGLGFAVKTGKGDFIGRDAVLAKREAGLSRRLVQFQLKDPEPLAVPQRGGRA